LGKLKPKKFDDALDFVIQTGITSMNSLQILALVVGLWPGWRRCTTATATTFVFRDRNRYIGAKKIRRRLKREEALLLEAQALQKTGNWCMISRPRKLFGRKVIQDTGKLRRYLKHRQIRNYISLIHPDDREKACNYFSTKQFTGDITFEYG